MRYLIPAMFAALMFTGCASHQCRHQQAEPEPQPSVEQVPLLADIPLMGRQFKRGDIKPGHTVEAPEPPKPTTRPAHSEPVDAELAADIPLLASIPLLGHLFKRVEKDDAGE